MHHPPSVHVIGTMFLSMVQACVNLSFFVDDEQKAWLDQIRIDQWYPLEDYNRILDIVVARYTDPLPILEQIGMEVGTLWYRDGPGFEVIGSQAPAAWLRLQDQSMGYYSMVRGAPAVIGEFALTALDEQQGTAVIRSTTPFSRDFERGVIVGCMAGIPGTLYVNADNSRDPCEFVIEFH